MKKNFLMYVIVFVMVVIIAENFGCGSLPWKKKEQAPPVELLDETKQTSESSGTTLIPGPQRFSDVPLPEGVKEDFERTYVYQSPTLQVGRMVYTLRADVNDIVQFYTKECPNHGWKLDNVLQGDGVQLNYSKPGKKLQVNVRPQGIGRPKQIVLTLTPGE
ncbi:MAG: hypothetical protein N3G21_09840 [Candidatus Hydrogenedentes bacterium]|nr:hypothetical protein [Candidatus Hydrogenedentota bacterium]